MGTKPKKGEVRRTTTYVIPENNGIVINDEQAVALAFRIESEIDGIDEVKIEKIRALQGKEKIAIVIYVIIPDGMRELSPLLGALVHKIDETIEGIIDDMFARQKQRSAVTRIRLKA